MNSPSVPVSESPMVEKVGMAEVDLSELELIDGGQQSVKAMLNPQPLPPMAGLRMAR